MKTEIEIILAKESDKAIWDNFIAHNDGSFYQLFSWSKILAQQYGYKPSYLKVIKDNKPLGIFPAVFRGFGYKKLVSLPFVDCAGWLGVDPQVSKTIITWLKANSADFEVFSADYFSRLVDVRPTPVYGIYSLNNLVNYETAFNLYHHKTKNMVRKAQKMDFQTLVVPPSADLVRTFSQLYTLTMKKVGTLTFSPNFFAEIAREFSDNSLLATTYHDKEVASMLWLFHFNKKIYVWANAYNEKYLGLGANYSVYDTAIRYSCEHYLPEIILGASPTNSPQAFFKERWGAQSRPVYLYSTNTNVAKSRWQLMALAKPIIQILPMPLYTFFSDLVLRQFS